MPEMKPKTFHKGMFCMAFSKQVKFHEKNLSFQSPLLKSPLDIGKINDSMLYWFRKHMKKFEILCKELWVKCISNSKNFKTVGNSWNNHAEIIDQHRMQKWRAGWIVVEKFNLVFPDFYLFFSFYFLWCFKFQLTTE